MARVRILRGVRGPDSDLVEGDVLELADEDAALLIGSGAAEVPGEPVTSKASRMAAHPPPAEPVDRFPEGKGP